MSGHGESVRGFHAHQAARPDICVPATSADITRAVSDRLSGIERQAEGVGEMSKDPDVRELARLMIQLITIMRAGR